MRRLGTILVVLAWLAVPATGLVWIVSQARSDLDQPPKALWVPASAASADLTKPAVIVPDWAAPVPLLAPAWDGLVEQSLVTPGDSVTTATPIAVVGGVTRLAVQTPAPFGRSLSSGSKGSDVAALNAVLRQLGQPSTDGDTFGTDTRTGVRQLAAKLGAGEVTTFDPSWFIYLPVGSATVGSVDLTVAAPAPSAGTPVLAFTPVLVSAVVVPPEAVVEPDSAGSDTATPTGPVRLDDGRLFTDLAPDNTLIVGGVVAGSVGQDGAISGDTLAAVAGQLPPGTRLLAATLSTPLPAGAVTVPAATVVTGADGTTCVLVRDGSGQRAVPVVVSDSYVDVATVSGEPVDAVRPGTEVWVAPTAEARAACRSM